MTDTPPIISRTRRRESSENKDFRFTLQDIRLEGLSPNLREYRSKAWETYQSLPLPTIRDEAWRRTDLSSLETTVFGLPKPEMHLDLETVPQDLLQPIADNLHAGEIVLLPGGSSVQLDPALAGQGVIFTTLQIAEREYPDLVDKMIGKVVHAAEGKFAALAATFGQDGVVLYVPRGVKIEQPLHSLLWGPGVHLAHFSHLLVWLDEDASVTYVHESASPTENGQTLHAGIVEIHVGQAAKLRFVELQSWGENVWNFSHERIQVERDGELEWVFGAIGSRLTKNFSELDLIGQGAVGKMSGFYFTDHDQHLDHDTQQSHLAPNTTSDLLFKGALLGSSRSVWQGMIYVAPVAMKTDGYQANRNLVLSSTSRADSIPGLEILADDVRCTHGATVGKIDPDLVFYLMSRGIPKFEAEKLIVEGFFDPIMQRIPFEGVKRRFQEAIHAKMQSYTGS